MKKIDGYEVFKISTDRLCREKYNINMTYEQSIMNKETVKLASSQLLRKLRELRCYKNSDTFISEYIAIVVNKECHYKKIKKSGIIVNGKKYIRLICGASNARNETVFMIREDLYIPMFEILRCGVNPINMVLSKWNAYFALNASSSYQISTPRVIVIPDYTVGLNHRFDFIEDDGSINERDVDIKDYPPFDGMGIMSVEFANQVSLDMELDYIPSAVVIRNTFIKGLVCTMDIKKFAKQYGVNNTIKDLWGTSRDINQIDMILTESQFKMWGEYQSWEHYITQSDINGLGWGVTILTHDVDDDFTFTNYQFLQTLNLDDKQVIELCKPTIDWIIDITGGNIYKLFLYLLGCNPETNIQNIDFDIKALLINHNLLEDSYIKTRIMRTLNKKIRQAYSGKLLVEGNFSFILSDPFALLQYTMGIKPIGLLGLNEYYNGYWTRKGVNTISGMRSPLTFASEVNVMKLKNNEECREWYKYVDNCCTILNTYGSDTMKFADADFDGDKIFTTNNVQIIQGKRQEFPHPITYNKKIAVKETFNTNKLYDIDMQSFGSKIGFITNCSTYWWSLLNDYDKDSEEYSELIKRLKLCRKLQGDEIDKSKGIETSPIPKHYTEYHEGMSSIDKALIAKKKPYFQKYVYPKLNMECKKYNEMVDSYHQTYDTLDDKLTSYLNNTNPILDNNSVMNRICHYLEENIKEIQRTYKKQDQNIVDNILIDFNRELLLEYTPQVKLILKEYKEFRKGERNGLVVKENYKDLSMKYKRFGVIKKKLRDKMYNILNNSIDIANLVVYVSYNTRNEEDKDFAWNVFGKEIFANVKNNSGKTTLIPVLCSNEEKEFTYLGKNYRKEIYKIENNV